ncbi:MAG: ABC transporter ATP-binding protein [Pseudomonadota bacterium]
MTSQLLEIDGFSLGFNTEAGMISVVEELSFDVAQGETVGLVGESGCGKSVTAMSVMRLLPSPPARVLRGAIRFDGRDLVALDERAMRDVRGNQIGMIFQEPMTSLNPTYTIGFQLREALQLHLPLSKKEAEERATTLMDRVGIGAASRRLGQYPHELSGGLRQRVMIAMAIACEPKLIIADEPTTALDVTIQAQILDLLRDLRAKLNTAILMITHDLGVVAEFCERVLVMYAGRVVEQADVFALFQRPRHPYTQGLLRSMPATAERGARLPMIKGSVPAPGKRGAGCPFADRCDRVQDRCRADNPELAPVTDEQARHVACWNPVP